MRENKREVIKKEYITEYIAFDGETFSDASECKKYEASAQAVCRKLAYQYRIAETTWSGLLSELMTDDQVAEIFDIRDADAYKAVANYISMENGGADSLPTIDCIGKELMVFWGYDHDWCIWCTLDDLIAEIRSEYDKRKVEYAAKKGEQK